MIWRFEGFWSIGLIAAAMLASSAAVVAQGSGQGSGTAPRPGAVETAPLPPPGGAGPSAGSPAPSTTTPPAAGPSTAQPGQAPGPSPTPAPGSSGQPAPATPPAAAPATASRPTLIETPGDPMDVDEVTLPSKPAAVLSGKSSWDDGFANLQNAFRRIEQELTRAGMKPAGRPLAVFNETDDSSFTYEAMIPVERAPDSRPPTLPQDIRFGATPEGKALRFVHKAPYDDIDSTYETITAYLDAKGVVVKDAFIEEYVNDATDAQDADLEINIFVQPR